MTSTAGADAGPDSRWWLPIAALLSVVLLQGVVGFVLPPLYLYQRHQYVGVP